MSATEVRGSEVNGTASADIDMNLEVVVIPVSDVDRAREFYAGLGWRLDTDRTGDNFRIVQFTPHGSGCAIQFGTNITTAEPGSVQDLYLTVSSIDAARAKLLARGVAVGEVFHEARDGARFHHVSSGRVSGPAPGHATYRSFAQFSDPDGNGWLFQEVTARVPGRIDPGATTFASATELAAAFRRASAAHGQHEKRIGQADQDWPDWYARYMIAEQAGTELPA
jgi:catechol 2,3-dioxygenase-like lactoylglutathione lyase family enzyme